MLLSWICFILMKMITWLLSEWSIYLFSGRKIWLYKRFLQRFIRPIFLPTKGEFKYLYRSLLGPVLFFFEKIWKCLARIVKMRENCEALIVINCSQTKCVAFILVLWSFTTRGILQVFLRLGEEYWYSTGLLSWSHNLKFDFVFEH